MSVSPAPFLRFLSALAKGRTCPRIEGWRFRYHSVGQWPRATKKRGLATNSSPPLPTNLVFRVGRSSYDRAFLLSQIRQAKSLDQTSRQVDIRRRSSAYIRRSGATFWLAPIRCGSLLKKNFNFPHRGRGAGETSTFPVAASNPKKRYSTRR